MSGITPDQGENYVASKVYINGNLYVGLWEGTWDNDETVTYAQADAEFTKITGTGLNEQQLNAWTVTNDNATHTTVTFTAGAGVTDQTINGYYIRTETNVLLHVERDPSPPTISTGGEYTVGLSNLVA